MSGLSLNYWLKIFGYNPYHAHQLATTGAGSVLAMNAQCPTLLFEQSYINADRAGRTQIRQSIERAETLVQQYAHFWPTPRFREDTLEWPRLADRRFDRIHSIDPQGRWLSVILDEGEIRDIGVKAETTPATCALTYTDKDSDSVFETATATAAVPAGTTVDEVIARFLVADCGPVTPQPEIEPRSVSVNTITNTATVVFDAWTLVRPIKTSGFSQAPLNPLDMPPSVTSPLAGNVEIFRRYCNSAGTTQDTVQALLVYETRPCPWAWACCSPQLGSPGDPAAVAYVLARAQIRDSAAGTIAVGDAVYDSITGTWCNVCNTGGWGVCYPPDRVIIRYLAGRARDGVQMAADWAIVVARLAAAELARPVCACEGANKELYTWQKDLSQTGATDDLYAAPGDLDNPLGARRGHIYAWRTIMQQQRVTGILAG